MLNFLKKLVAKVLIPAACLLSIVPILNLGFLQNSRANDDMVAQETASRQGDSASGIPETARGERDLSNFEAVQVIETSEGKMYIDINGRTFIFREQE